MALVKRRVRSDDGAPVELSVPRTNEVVIGVAGRELRLDIASWEELDAAIDRAAGDGDTVTVTTTAGRMRVRRIGTWTRDDDAELGVVEVASVPKGWRFAFRNDDSSWLSATDDVWSALQSAMEGNQRVQAHWQAVQGRRKRRKRWAAAVAAGRSSRWSRRAGGRRALSVVRRTSGGRHATPYSDLGFTI